ncbi:MAG: hypothetical protein LBV23_06640 [Deltaproteobacteria bacterium]|jgi:hypothetical protein|nr:hypothetical protein [Deltaproteobacteria bacterium]
MKSNHLFQIFILAFVLFWVQAALAPSFLSSDSISLTQDNFSSAIQKALIKSGAPPELAAWAPWVLYDQDDFNCPKVGQNSLCLWPLSLKLNLNSNGGTFELAIELKGQKNEVPLPGQPGAWPENVQVSSPNGAFKTWPTSGLNRPLVVLPEGRHIIKGLFNWSSLPQFLTIPMAAVIEVNIDGHKVGFPTLDDDFSNFSARLWLKKTNPPAAVVSTPSATQNSLKVQIDRLAVDSQPLALTTRVRLTVSGNPREELIENISLPGLRPLYLNSPLPARLTAQGLRIQVKAGIYDVFIDSNLTSPANRLGPVPEGRGPERWAFVQQPYLRQVEVLGANQIDPSQVEPFWPQPPLAALDPLSASALFLEPQSLPIYELAPGQSLEFKVLRLGDPEPGPDLLSLKRECWLDYNGRGLSCSDKLTGQMRRNWCLTVDSPYDLAQASLNGQPQVITWQLNSKNQKAPGIQLRSGILNLTADLRIDNFQNSFPASGWDRDLSTSRHLLNLPPGFRLLKLSGAAAFTPEFFPASWWDSWTTFDIFAALIIVIATYKLLNLKWAIFALASTILSYQEFMAPRLVFLHVLGAAALLSVLPKQGKAKFFTEVWRLSASLILILLTVNFVIHQARIALYPQLEQVDRRYRGSIGWPIGRQFASHAAMVPYNLSQEFNDEDINDSNYLNAQAAPHPANSSDREDFAPKPPAAPRSQSLEPEIEPGTRRKREVSVKQLNQNQSSNLARQFTANMNDAKLSAQNSAPRPNWRWRSIELSYNGQISKDQTVKLILAGPVLFTTLCFLRILFLVSFTVAVISTRGGFNLIYPLSRVFKFSFPAKVSVIALIFIISGLFSSPIVSAQQTQTLFPPPYLLEALRERLLTKQNIPAPSFPSLIIEPDSSGRLKMTVKVEASGQVAAPLPSIDPKIFRVDNIEIQGAGPVPLAADSEGFFIALITEGISSIVIEGHLNTSQGFQISFKRQAEPSQVILQSQTLGWSLSGIDERNRPSGNSIFVNPPESNKTESDQIDPNQRQSVGLSSINPEEMAQGDGESANSLSSGAEEILEPFFMVDRAVSLGLEWKIYTTVVSLVPAVRPVTVTVPLLKGERVTTSQFSPKDGKMVLIFPIGVSVMEWESVLEVNLDKPIEFTAAAGPYAESWSLDASPIWSAQSQGLIPIHNLSSRGLWNPRWRPWPGDKLSISVSKPEPAPGLYTVIDQASIGQIAGLENRQYNLKFFLRTSQGGPFVFTLPKGAQIQSLSLDGRSLPISSTSDPKGEEGPKVTLPINPGLRQAEVSWLTDDKISTIIKMPPLNLGVKAANINYQLLVPNDRWILLTGGPVQGPAVLFWSFSAALLILSFFLSGLRLTPLKTASWFLLFVGLSQMSLSGSFITAFWLIVLGLRGRGEWIKGRILFNLSQIALFLWTIVSIALIYYALQHALLDSPSMRVTGNGSYGHNLNWFIDRAQGLWPQGWVLTIPDKVYRLVMLAWALWLALNIIGWLKWGWLCFSNNGFWRPSPPKPPKPPRHGPVVVGGAREPNKGSPNQLSPSPSQQEP